MLLSGQLIQKMCIVQNNYHHCPWCLLLLSCYGWLQRLKAAFCHLRISLPGTLSVVSPTLNCIAIQAPRWFTLNCDFMCVINNKCNVKPDSALPKKRYSFRGDFNVLKVRRLLTGCNKLSSKHSAIVVNMEQRELRSVIDHPPVFVPFHLFNQSRPSSLLLGLRPPT